jgi:hypothetical protein
VFSFDVSFWCDKANRSKADIKAFYVIYFIQYYNMKYQTGEVGLSVRFRVKVVDDRRGLTDFFSLWLMFSP